jgi:hypothetical protein
LADQHSNFIDQIVTSLANHIGLNGAQALLSSRAPQTNQPQPEKQSDYDALRKQGWSDSDIKWLQQQEAKVKR